MRKGKDPEPDPDPYLWLLDPGGAKHADPADSDPVPDPQHWLRQIKRCIDWEGSLVAASRALDLRKLRFRQSRSMAVAAAGQWNRCGMPGHGRTGRDGTTTAHFCWKQSHRTRRDGTPLRPHEATVTVRRCFARRTSRDGTGNRLPPAGGLGAPKRLGLPLA
jgi:hypothetical protein